MKVYLDSSFLIAFLFEHEREDYDSIERIFSLIDRHKIEACISLYNLSEIRQYVEQNSPAEIINELFRLAIFEIVCHPIAIIGYLKRNERERLYRQFKISDRSDALHVANAMKEKCDKIISFDTHFKEVESVIDSCTPDEFLDIEKKEGKLLNI